MKLTAEEMTDRVLYRDGLIIVFNKPAGIPVHGGPAKKTNLEQYFDALRFGLPHPPGLAHRLDRDTSGCLVLGRHPKALRKVGKLFMEGKVNKTYWAVVRGRPPQNEGRIDLPLYRVLKPEGWRILVDERGQESITDYKVLGHGGELTWLELYPRTGRTHQIRVHCAHMGFPVVGDSMYGTEDDRRQGIPLHLHSHSITLPLSASNPPVHVAADPPEHMLEALTACGYSPDKG